ncbi:MAG: CHAT domain-containing protein [Desulfomonile tiedjei]|uniref:CHAT domain-containing protein n=1 Tax=Desulfomonile tiedjei TaxID=2358 RepID=A0A9D6Z4N3_9BACT|nr:CHAT domain-containing protein [Desulfomonile tiedjei]
MESQNGSSHKFCHIGSEMAMEVSTICRIRTALGRINSAENVHLSSIARYVTLIALGSILALMIDSTAFAGPSGFPGSRGGVRTTVTPGTRTTTPTSTITTPPRTQSGVHPPTSHGVNIGVGIGTILPHIPLGIKHPHVYPSDEQGHYVPEEEPEPDDDDDEDKPKKKAKPKKVQSTTERAPQPPRPAAVEVKEGHPETLGSVDSRMYFFRVTIGIDDSIAEAVLRDPKGKERSYLNALQDAQKRKDGQAEFRATKSLGDVYFLMGLMDKALAYYRKAQSLVPGFQEESGRLRVINSIGASSWAMGDFEMAERYYNEVLSARADITNSEVQAQAHNNLGILYQTSGKPQASAQQFNQALEAAGKDPELRRNVTANLLESLQKQGKFSEAETVAKRALEDARNVWNPKLKVFTLQSVGSLYLEWARVTGDQAKYNQALEQFESALKIAQSAGIPKYYAAKLVGDVYLEMGRPQMAEPYIKTSGFNSSLARLHLIKGELKEAKVTFEKLSETARRHGREEDYFVAQTGLGKISESSEDYGSAVKHYSEAAQSAERIRASRLVSERKDFFHRPVNGFLPSEAAKGLSRVHVKEDSKKSSPNQSVFGSEFARARQFADHVAQKADLGLLGFKQDLMDREKKLVATLASLSKARDLLTREQHPDAYDEKTKAIEAAEVKFKEFVDLLWKNHSRYAAVRYPKPIELQNAAIQPDEFVLLLDAVGNGVAVRLIKGKQIIKTSYVDWNNQELNAVINRFREPFERHAGTVQKGKLEQYDPALGHKIYSRLLADVMRSVPEMSSVVILPEECLGKLPFETLVVGGRISWGKDEGGAYPDGLVYFGDRYRIQYNQSLTSLTLGRAMPKGALSGDRLLVMADPIPYCAGQEPDKSRQLDTPNTVVASKSVQDGSLDPDVHGQAPKTISRISSGDQTMAPAMDLRAKVDLTSTSSAPAQSQETGSHPVGIQQNTSSATPVQDSGAPGLVWPRLELTGELGKSVERIYLGQTDLFVEQEATKERLTRQSLAGYQCLLFATHGYYGNDIPGVMEPVLVLSSTTSLPDPYLRMSEVLDLDLNAELVVLAACETGIGQYKTGEGIMSMGRAFQYAGAKTVLMSLWTVSERASMVFVEEFMKSMKQGQKPAEALASARNQVRSISKRYSHPFYWASFVLVGEGSQVPEKAASEARDNLLRAAMEKPPTLAKPGHLILGSVASKGSAGPAGASVSRRQDREEDWDDDDDEPKSKKRSRKYKRTNKDEDDD